jgi:hypothetical protein
MYKRLLELVGNFIFVTSSTNVGVLEKKIQWNYFSLEYKEANYERVERYNLKITLSVKGGSSLRRHKNGSGRCTRKIMITPRNLNLEKGDVFFFMFVLPNLFHPPLVRERERGLRPRKATPPSAKPTLNWSAYPSPHSPASLVLNAIN